MKDLRLKDHIILAFDVYKQTPKLMSGNPFNSGPGNQTKPLSFTAGPTNRMTNRSLIVLRGAKEFEVLNDLWARSSKLGPN